jgi:hypothetical protein
MKHLRRESHHPPLSSQLLESGKRVSQGDYRIIPEHTVSLYAQNRVRCGRTFRVYPEGVCRDQFSRRTKGLAVALYLLCIFEHPRPTP